MENPVLQQPDVKTSVQLCWVFLVFAVFAMLPDLVFALQVDTPMGNVICTVTGWFTGNTGKGLATIGITVIGIGALFGKVSWGMAIVVGIGVAIVFGAGTIVGALDTPATPIVCTTS